jgi:carbonic anhydrase
MPEHLLQRNRDWAADAIEANPDFFDEFTEGQSPRFLWISCSDSRVPANEIVQCHPGDLFVHRNIANRIDHDDLNGLSVLQYAVEVLNVPHIVVCGHYQCGGVKAAMEHTDHGLIDNWLRPIKHVYHHHSDELDAIDDEKARWDRLCELNVIDQVLGVAYSTVIQKAWLRGQKVAIHGWIYQLSDGIIRNLDVTVDSPEQVPPIYRASTSASDSE